MIEIRQGNWNDLKGLVVIKLEGLMTSYALPEFFINEFHKRWVASFSAGMRVLILIKDGKFSGFLNYYHYSKLNRELLRVSEIDNIYIVPALRRQGYGRKLFQAFLQEVQLINHEQIKVRIDDAHPIMVRFYEALGFKYDAHQSENGEFKLFGLKL